MRDPTLSSSLCAVPPGVVCRAKALYAYKKCNDDEFGQFLLVAVVFLSCGLVDFEAGTVFDVLSKDSENWWTGKLRGVTALLPANYVEVIQE